MALTFSSSGRAALCFPQDGNWFQGYFICAGSRAQLGLMGEEIPVDDWYVLAWGCRVLTGADGAVKCGVSGWRVPGVSPHGDALCNR
jgi:hypothetical protein